MDLPIIDYEAISAGYAARGTDVRDLFGSQGHFDRWRKRHGLPEAADAAQSREQFGAYKAADDGEAACPVYADLWHYLLDVTKDVTWQRHGRRKARTMEVCVAMLAIVPDLTAEQLAAGRERLEAANGPLPDDVWMDFARQASNRPTAQRECRRILVETLERHGIEVAELAEYGRMARIRLIH